MPSVGEPSLGQREATLVLFDRGSSPRWKTLRLLFKEGQGPWRWRHAQARWWSTYILKGVPDPSLPQYPPQYPGQYPAYPEYSPGFQAPSSQRPVSVTNAMRLMYVGAALSGINMALGVVLGIANKSAFRTAIHKAQPKLSPSQVSSEANLLLISIVVAGAIGVGLWLWMAWANGRGRKWARVMGTILFGLDTLILLGNLAQHEPAVSLIFSVIVWGIGLGTVLLLWRRDSTEYFNAPKYG